MSQSTSSQSRDRWLPRAWCWLLPVAYTAHFAEEFFSGTGFYTWVGRWATFSAPSFLGVNFMIISLIAVAVGLSRTRRWAGFLLVAVSVHFAVHGLVIHPVSTAWAGEFSPGLISGLVVLVPLAAVGWLWARRSLDRAALAWGTFAGALLLASQDLWRILFNRVL